ncbi:YiiX/YebB-like N1pC/P60 family cysteine hydrolase [Gloeomargarita sp.]
MASGKLPLPSKPLWATAVCLTLLLLGIFYALGNRRYPSFAKPLDWQAVTGQLSDGDLIFRTGSDIISRAVLTQSHAARFAHVGIILKSESELVVVHALPGDHRSPGGVVLEPLRTFAAQDKAIAIGFYRVKHINSNIRNHVRNYSLAQVGKPFDYRFLLSDDQQLYCTELVVKAFAEAGINLTTSLPKLRIMLMPEPVFPPDTLRHSSQLEPILQ